MTASNRLGFAVKVLGQRGLKSNDARRWQNDPHLRVSLEYLHKIVDYLIEADIRMYRISSDIAPYITHPDLPRFHGQIEECQEELSGLGDRLRRHDIRVSMHPSQYIVLNSPNERVAESAARDFDYHARFLDSLGVGHAAVIVTHVGGVYGDRPAAMQRFIDRYRRLPERVRARSVLENDEVSYPVSDIRSIHEVCGIPLVFDILHHRVNNPSAIDDDVAARLCLSCWPAEIMPKMHFSTQREFARTQPTGHEGKRLAKPGEHDDGIDGDDFVSFLNRLPDIRFDVMLEAKLKDLALLALRNSIARASLGARIW